MKSAATFLILSALLLAPWMCASVFAQQSDNNDAKSEKKIVIIKRTTDTDGSEVTETIVKKGKAAEDFDVDKYVRENRSDKVQVEVRVTEGNGDNTYTYNFNRKSSNDQNDWLRDLGQGLSWSSCDDTKAFLGVEEDSDEDDDEPGLVVEVVRGSAADKAGLHDNDLILRLNDKNIDDWGDLTSFVQSQKPGDKVKIAYRRNGKDATAEATLTTRKEVKNDSKTPRGFLGVSEMGDDDEDNAGVEVSITRNSSAEKAGLQRGDVIMKLDETEIEDFEDISDFMDYTKPGDKVKVTFKRNGKLETTEAAVGEQKSWNWNEWNQGNTNWKDLNINVSEKEACLGVYTQATGTGDDQGARINGFTDESAAVEAKMLESDVITAVNGMRVKGHNDLWNEIAKYAPGDKVKVEYLRSGKTETIEATLKACKDNSSRVTIFDTDDNSSRRFFTWNWNESAAEKMRKRQMITIHRGEGDAPKTDAKPQAEDRTLKLASYRAYPNPTPGQLTVEFRAEAVPTIVSLFDLGGRQLFREELNAFSGEYNQQFDLSEYAKGTILVHIQQGDKVYTEQVVVN